MVRALFALWCAVFLATDAALSGPAERLQAAEAPVQSGGYWCTMHPNIRGQKGDICPICHMPLVAVPPADYEPYHVDLSVLPAAPTPGHRVQFRLTIRDPRTNSVVRSLDVVHERILHLFLISQDLEHFEHVHPEQQPDGSLVQAAVLPRPGVYRLIADFLPSGGTPQLIQHVIVTRGFTGSVRPSSVLAPDIADKVVAGVRVKLSMPEPVAGREQLLTIELQDETTGRALADLEPYLGAVGHLLLVSADFETVAHSHPVAEMSSGMGPTIVFTALFPRPGAYRCWVQFQRHDSVLVVPFTVVARPPRQLSER
jgi:hypothetical protein